MMNRTVVLVLLVVGVLAGVLQGSRAEWVTRRPVSLEAVPDLEKPVTYRETKIPLGELLRKVAADTGVSLAAAKEVADEPVAVVVSEMPARKLLKELAELLDYQWSRSAGDEGGYLIWQDAASKQREEALREAAIEERERRFQEQVRSYGVVASMPLVQMDRMWDENRQLQEQRQAMSPKERDAFDRSTQAREWAQRVYAARAIAQSPIRQTLAQLLGAITPQLWAQAVRGGQPLVFSTQPQAGELPLPPEIAQALHASQPTLYPPAVTVSYAGSAGEQYTLRREAELQAKWAVAAGYRVTIREDTSHGQVDDAPNFVASAEAIANDNSSLTPRGGLIAGTSLPVQTIGPPPAAEEPAQQGAAIGTDPVLSAKKSLSLRAMPGAPSSVGVGMGTTGRLQDLLPALARTYGVQFISDAYWSSPHLTAGMISGDPVSLYEVLQRVAAPSHHWDRRGNLVRLRSRTWSFDRPQEVPLRLVRRWQELCAQQGALPSEEWQRVAALSDSQLSSLSQVAAETGLPPEFSGVYGVRWVLRLYAALTPEQRDALRQGQTILGSRLSGQQRQLFLAVLEADSRSPVETLRSVQLAGGSVSAGRYDFVRVRQQRGDSVTYVWEPVGQDAASPGAGGSSGAGAASRSTTKGAVGAGTSTRHPLTQFTLYLQYAPEVRESGSITLPRPPAPGTGLERPRSTPGKRVALTGASDRVSIATARTAKGGH
jgi:hypothetical protein